MVGNLGESMMYAKHLAAATLYNFQRIDYYILLELHLSVGMVFTFYFNFLLFIAST